LDISFWCVGAYELSKESGFQLFDVVNPMIKNFAFDWVQYLQIINDECFSFLNHNFVTAINEQANNAVLLLYSMPALQTT